MSLCVLTAAGTMMLTGATFTLSWTHSVEKSRWEEVWRVTPAGLEIVEARVQGSGAGMEPPEDARLVDGWWIYRPPAAFHPRIVLATSGTTGEGWRLCAGAQCVMIDSDSGGVAVLSACGPEAQ